jgi:acyl-CoA synthetase (NDP forming)
VASVASHADEVRSSLDRGKEMLVESDFKKILSLYGIPVTQERLAGSVQEAADIAAALGYPVALKVMSPQLLHKTEARVIELNISNSDQLRSAYDKILKNAAAYSPGCQITGVLVQEMVRPGVEVILGMKRDPQFGPLAMFGLGGIFVEIFKDVSFFFPPITQSEAHELIKRIKGYPILQGARGRKEADTTALAETMVQFSHLCVDMCEMFKEIDLNPLIVAERGSGLKVVDVLMVPC